MKDFYKDFRVFSDESLECGAIKRLYERGMLTMREALEAMQRSNAEESGEVCRIVDAIKAGDKYPVRVNFVNKVEAYITMGNDGKAEYWEIDYTKRDGRFKRRQKNLPAKEKWILNRVNNELGKMEG